MTNRVTISADGDSNTSNNNSSAEVRFNVSTPDTVDVSIDKTPKTKTIDNVVEQYKINDAVAFATITVNLYQPVQTYTSTIVNTEAAFRVPFSTSVSESLRNGLFLLQKLIAAVITLWPFWILLGLFF